MENNCNTNSYYLKGIYKDKNKKCVKYRKIQFANNKSEAILQFEKYFNDFHFNNIACYDEFELNLDKNKYNKRKKELIDKIHGNSNIEPYICVLKFKEFHNKIKEKYGPFCKGFIYDENEINFMVDKLKEGVYLQGILLMKNESFDLAKEIFEFLEDYKNSSFYFDFCHCLLLKDEINKCYDDGMYQECVINLNNVSSFIENCVDSSLEDKYIDFNEQLSKFNDFKDKILNKIYTKGIIFLKKKKFEEAEDIFLMLNDYKYSDFYYNYSQFATYEYESIELFNDDRFNEGFELLEILIDFLKEFEDDKIVDDYIDVDKKIRQLELINKKYSDILYEKAKQLLKEEQYEDAQELFKILGEYKNSSFHNFYCTVGPCEKESVEFFNDKRYEDCLNSLDDIIEFLESSMDDNIDDCFFNLSNKLNELIELKRKYIKDIYKSKKYGIKKAIEMYNKEFFDSSIRIIDWIKFAFGGNYDELLGLFEIMKSFKNNRFDKEKCTYSDGFCLQFSNFPKDFEYDCQLISKLESISLNDDIKELYKDALIKINKDIEIYYQEIFKAYLYLIKKKRYFTAMNYIKPLKYNLKFKDMFNYAYCMENYYTKNEFYNSLKYFDLIESSGFDCILASNGIFIVLEIDKCYNEIYNNGIKKYSNKLYEEALKDFELISGYNDSNKMVESCKRKIRNKSRRDKFLNLFNK